MSERAALSCGVPQGSILGPLFFALYMLSIGHIVSQFKGITYVLLMISKCMCPLNLIRTTIKAWMTNNFLQLNTHTECGLYNCLLPRLLSVLGYFLLVLQILVCIFDQFKYFK